MFQHYLEYHVFLYCPQPFVITCTLEGLSQTVVANVLPYSPGVLALTVSIHNPLHKYIASIKEIVYGGNEDYSQCDYFGKLH